MYKIEKYNFGWSQSKPRVTITLGQHWDNIASGPEASSIPSQPHKKMTKQPTVKSCLPISASPHGVGENICTRWNWVWMKPKRQSLMYLSSLSCNIWEVHLCQWGLGSRKIFAPWNHITSRGMRRVQGNVACCFLSDYQTSNNNSS